MDQLKRDLREHYLQTYKECSKFKYFPTLFLRMITSDEDIVDITRRLIHKDGGTSGFTTLFENGRMDLSVERIILEPQYRVLFTKEDLRTAYERLWEYGYAELDKIEKP